MPNKYLKSYNIIAKHRTLNYSLELKLKLKKYLYENKLSNYIQNWIK